MVTTDVLEADVLQTIAWAREEIADEGLYAVALVGERGQDDERGLVWLVGIDANDFPANPHEEGLRRSMDTRRGKTVVNPSI